MPQNPTIYITDIIPEGERAVFAGFDGSRTAELDMSEYRDYLSAGIRGLAHHRAITYIRQKERSDDYEYVDQN